MRFLGRYFIVLLLVFSVSNLFADELDDFIAPNYVYLEETISSKGDITNDLKSLLSGSLVFLYVSGCHLDGETLPSFQALTSKYPKAKFIRISQHSSAADYLLERYGSFGAPKIYLMLDGNILSAMQNYYERKNGRSKHIGWAKSVKKWAKSVYPVVKKIYKYRNVEPVSSYNYRNIFQGKKVVLLRARSKSKDFVTSIKSLFGLAKKYPNVQFALDTGPISYNQEFSYKYTKAINGFSIIDDVDNIKAVFRKPYRDKNFNMSKLSKWVNNNIGVNKNDSKASYDSNYLKNIFSRRNSRDLAILPPADFKKLNNSGKVISKLRIQQSFYVIINAIGDSSRNLETAKLLVKELSYKSKGGIKVAVKSKILRNKVYAVVLRRVMKHERNQEILNLLKKVESEYMVE